MISHILFNLFSRYNIGSFGFRKILAMLITVLIFGLLYLTVRFTGVDIPNYTRNLVMLVSVDLAGFLFLMWKRPKEPVKEEEVVEVEVEVKDKEKEKEVAPALVVDEKTATKNVKKVEEVKEVKEVKKVEEVEEVEEVVIKKIEDVEEVDNA
jgi:outer membrane biosynthesis protein TonB